MASRASFTQDEWARVMAAPVVTGLAITAADPSGLWGLLKEGMTSSASKARRQCQRFGESGG
jgi:hypothetical protein